MVVVRSCLHRLLWGSAQAYILLYGWRSVSPTSSPGFRLLVYSVPCWHHQHWIASVVRILIILHQRSSREVIRICRSVKILLMWTPGWDLADWTKVATVTEGATAVSRGIRPWRGTFGSRIKWAWSRLSETREKGFLQILIDRIKFYN